MTPRPRRGPQCSLHGAILLGAACSAIVAIAPASAHGAIAYVPGKVLVRYVHAARAHQAGGLVATGITRVVHVPASESIASRVRRLRARRDVVWAVPDYIAHASVVDIPNDPGVGSTPGGWQQLQWNFAGAFGVNAPEAWANVAADGAPGGRGVTVAVLDTGVAYAKHGPFRRSPDFSRFGFVQGYDFIARNRQPVDHNGHGTFVAGTIAEATNNRYGLTGLAFDARIMPVRVLDAEGEGEASTIAQGVRFAVRHGARI